MTRAGGAVGGAPGGSHDGGFRIEVPALSRGSADRHEDLRSAAHVRGAWPSARLITVGADGRVPVRQFADGPKPAFGPAPAQFPEPPAGAVLLGSVDGVDHWAMLGEVAGGVPFRAIGPLLSDVDAGMITTAVAVLSWHASAGFCPRCGLPSDPDVGGLSRRCPAGHQEFPRTDPAVIVLVHDGAGHVLLARQPSWAPGRFSVLAGFTEAGESLEGTVLREVREEVGVTVGDVSYLGSQPWPFPRSLMIAFAARAPQGAPIVPRSGEIERAEWFSRDRVAALLAAGGAEGGVSLPDPISIARRMLEGWVRG